MSGQNGTRRLFLGASAAAAVAQAKPEDSTSVLHMDELLDAWTVSKAFTLAVAAAMPPEGYAFRPNPEEMTFGALMFHIAVSQAFRIAQVAGTDPPFSGRPEANDPLTAAKWLTTSFDFCLAQLRQMKPEGLTQSYKVDWVGKPEAKGSQILVAMLVHTAHHRAQAEVYLRVKGIKPPAYTF